MISTRIVAIPTSSMRERDSPLHTYHRLPSMPVTLPYDSVVQDPQEWR